MIKTMVTITKIHYPAIFKVGSYVGFDLSDGTHYEGEITKTQGIFLKLNKVANDKIFKKLEILNRKGFVESIVGYDVYGDWPEVKSLEDLKKVLRALESYNHGRIPESEKVIISDDEKEPFTLSIKKKRSTILNFKI